VKRRKSAWRCDEQAVLRRLYENPKVSWPEIEAAIPRHPISSIAQMARTMGLRRRRTTKRPTVPIFALLWERREALKITRYDLAAHMGYHYAMLGRWERGDAMPSLQKLIDWAETLGLALALEPIPSSARQAQAANQDRAPRMSKAL
jgi:DNA-binding transcriptional regulator YiaG